MSTILRVRSSGSAFCRNYQRTKESRSLEGLVEASLLSVFPISLVASVMLSTHAELSSHVLAIRERESGE